MRQIFKGKFYDFHKERVMSAPGKPLVTSPGYEIGAEIQRDVAIMRVRNGRDVYTLFRTDAKQLARDAARARPVEDFPHEPSTPTRSGRDDVFYPHFHPGGLHPNEPGGPGHIFYGERGEGFDRGN